MAANPVIGRAAADDAAAVYDATALCDRNHRRVYAFCLAQLRNADEAGDAAQTTFVRALGALRRGDEPRSELAWLLAIARNVCHSRREAGKRRRHLEVAVDPVDLAELASAPAHAELLDGIEDALLSLPELQRRAVLLRDWQGLSYKEIADDLGVSLAAAETLIFRGRGALARELSGEDQAPSRRSGLASLLGLFKSALAGGGAAAKLTLGAAAVVGIGVAGSRELVRPAHPPAARPAAVIVREPAAAPVAARTMPVTIAGHRPVSRPARALRRRIGRPAATARVVARTPRRRTAQTATAQTATAPAPTAGPSTSATAPAAPAATVPAQAPAAAEPTAAAAATVPAAAAPAAELPPHPAPHPAPHPTPHPAAPTPTPPAAAPPPAQVTAPPAPVGTPVTAAAQPVVTTVTGAAAPVVTTAADAVGRGVTTATDAVAPVVTTATAAATVTNAPPPLPAPPSLHLP